MASQNRKYYEALAHKQNVTVVEASSVAVIEAPEFPAKVAWEQFFAASKCKVCGNATSATTLHNFGGVCNRCHYQHRFPRS